VSCIKSITDEICASFQCVVIIFFRSRQTWSQPSFRFKKRRRFYANNLRSPTPFRAVPTTASLYCPLSTPSGILPIWAVCLLINGQWRQRIQYIALRDSDTLQPTRCVCGMDNIRYRINLFSCSIELWDSVITLNTWKGISKEKKSSICFNVVYYWFASELLKQFSM
jgi:hypothetical protein